MGAGARISIPAGYYDKTSDDLLKQPEPQYLYGMLWLGAMGASLAAPSMIGLPGRAVGGVGADYAPADLARLRLSEPMFTSVVNAKVDFNASTGSTVRINRPVYTNTTYTESARRIPSGSSISTVPVTLGSEQTHLTLYKYGGPYDQTNSRIAPHAIEAFDANMGVHNLARMHGQNLVRDFHKFVDAVQVSLLDLAASTVYPDGMSADNDATTAGSFPFTYEQLCRTERKMDDAFLPTFPDGFRVLVLTPTQAQQLRIDPVYRQQSAFFPQYNALFPTYIGSVNKFHVFKSSTLTTTNNSSSVAIHKGHAIAPGALLGGMGRMPRVMPSTDDNYGETAKAVWLADLAFGLADNRFVYSVRSSADA